MAASPVSVYPVSGSLLLLDGGASAAFSFEDMMRYHGGGSPGGVAHAFKVLERALPLLGPEGPLERREIVIRTAFAGPGARDGFELVTRAVTENRYAIDRSLVRPERGAAEDFVFCVATSERTVTLALRDGYVTDEFIVLARARERSDDQERRLAEMKAEMARVVMSANALDVYDVADPH